ncbi:MAG: tRNA pseudouridine(54/55) synthase Pus10 [Planctomycetota bacterium]
MSLAEPSDQTHPLPHPRPRQGPRARVFLESRYRKHERGLPQTIFYCPDCKGHRRRRKGCERCGGFGKLTKDSVQELLGRHILPAFKGRYGKFHGAGREDIDVLMLGRGRPFVYEVVAPKVLDVDLQELQQRIQDRCAGRIGIDPFTRVSKGRVAFWKESKLDKVYRVQAVPGGDVDPARVDELIDRTVDVVQRTPKRVAFRRADRERERQVTVRTVELVEDHLKVEVQCQHGTYVKEWVSGDEGRTRPSLAELLGVSCTCEQLDVLEILTD